MTAPFGRGSFGPRLVTAPFGHGSVRQALHSVAPHNRSLWSRLVRTAARDRSLWSRLVTAPFGRGSVRTAPFGRGSLAYYSVDSLAHSSATRPAGRNFTVTALRPIRSAISDVRAF